MPNWCSAYAEVQGTQENILRFLKEVITWSKRNDKHEVIDIPEPMIIVEGTQLKMFDGSEAISLYETYMTGSSRCFADIEHTVDMKLIGATIEQGEIYEIGFPIEIAWGPDREYFSQLAMNYNVCIELDAEEQGVWFHGHGVFGADGSDTYEEYDLTEWRKFKRQELFPDVDFSSQEAEECIDEEE